MSRVKEVSQRGPVTLIKLNKGAPVRIHCPRPDKYPSFAASYHGRACKVLTVEPNGAADIIQVDVSNESEPGAWINVHRAWLQHRRAA